MGANQSNSNQYPYNNRRIIPATKQIKQLTNKIDTRYGGEIYINPIDKVAYRILEVPAQELIQQQIENDQIYTKGMTSFDFKKFIEVRIKLGKTQPNFLTVNDYRIQKSNSQMCSFSQQRIILQFPYPYQEKTKGIITLQDRIAEFCKLKMPFPESQLRIIFHQLVSILKFLRHNRTCHGDIKPKNIIFIYDENFSPKELRKKIRVGIIDSYLTNIGKTSYQIVLENPQSLSLLSPQLLSKLNNKNQHLGKNKQKQKGEGLYPIVHRTQIFAVGLCMLQAMTAENAMECYDLAALRIKQGYFNTKGQQMRRYGYSPQLVQLVLACFGIKQHSNFVNQHFPQSPNNNFAHTGKNNNFIQSSIMHRPDGTPKPIQTQNSQDSNLRVSTQERIQFEQFLSQISVNQNQRLY